VNLRRLAMAGLAESRFLNARSVMLAEALSLFLPVIESAHYSGNACAAGLSGVFDRYLGVFFQNDPDIGIINRETGSYLTAHTASLAVASCSLRKDVGIWAQY
jgi:hypothetical protein